MSTSETPATPPTPPSNPTTETANGSENPTTGSLESTAVPPVQEAPVDEYEELTPELVEDEAIRGDFVIRWAVVLLAFLLASTKINEEATLVEIKTGQYIASHGFLPPATDVFSTTAAGRPWPHLTWAFDLLLASVYTGAESLGISGFVGISVFKALLATITFGFLAHISRRGVPSWWSSICAAFALVACHLRFAPHPTLITFLGLSILFWSLHRFREKGIDPETKATPRLWALLPLFLVWCNLDSRAFLGLACLLLYALGETVGGLLGGTTSLSSAARKHLWVVGAGCVLMTLIHPWHYHSLLSPTLVYGVEYTAIREYSSMAYLGEARPVFSATAFYFPLWYGALWEQFDYAGAGAIGVILAAVALFLFNARRIVWGELFAFAGMVAFAVLCLRELPAAAIVAGIVAGLNGQAWYAANFSGVYSTNSIELLFSRGGRAITVLALAVIAFFGGTGRLRDQTAPQSGYGLDHTLASQIGDLQARLVGLKPVAADSDAKTDKSPLDKKQAVVADDDGPRSFDDRPFNYTVRQGDLLIWIGQKPFVDSRLVCYYDVDRERNLLATSQKVQQALRTPRLSAIASMTGRSIVKGAEAAEIAKLAGERRAFWRKIFDQYQITHLIPRLSISSAQKREYEAFTDLLNSPQGDWRLVDLGATCAVLYRTDLDNPELKKFIKDRSIDFKELAYRRGANPIGARDRWVRSPGFYQRYLWSERRDIPPAIQQALQFVQMAALPQWTETLQTLTLPPEYADSRAALALLAIRKAQEGLQDDPDSYWGYLVLGEAYSLLSKWDASIAQNPSRTPYSGLRYFQAVAAFNQALTASPDNVEAHQQLASLYGQANRIDLELRHQEALFERLNPIEDIDAEQLLTIETRIRDLTKKRDAAKEQEAKGEDQGRPPFDRAIELAQKGFVLGALEILDRVSESRAGNLSAEQLRIFLQLEAGRVEEAHENGERFAQPAQESRVPNWQEPVAFVNLPNADYPRAQTLWAGKSEEATKESLNNLLSSLVPRPAGLNGWPLATTSSTANWIFERPEVICESKLNLALIYLEEGNLASAQRELEQALAANPETANRNLIAHYLTELRGTEADIEPYPPSQTVPGLFATDEEFANRAPIVDDLAD